MRFTFNDKANRETPLILASSTPILPKHAIDPEKFEQAGLGAVVGSGPYRIKTLRPGERIIWERNPDYWGKDIPGKVGFDNYDEISVTYFLQVTTMFEAFKKGDIDIYPEGDAISSTSDTSHWGQAYNFPAVHRGDIVRTSSSRACPPACSASFSTPAAPSSPTKRCARACPMRSISNG